MRQLLTSLVLCAIAASGTACDTPAGSQARAETSGEFHVLIPGRPHTLNPNLSADDVAYVIGRSLFSHLVSANEAGRLLPELAETWSVSPDGQTYTFRLRRGVKWHDGVPLTSADVRWTLEAVARDGIASDALAPVAAVETPDPLTVVIRLTSPWAPFAANLAGQGLAILPEHVYAKGGWRTSPANHRPVGSGPFRFGEWRDENTLVLEANDEYFRSGPYVERLVFSVASADRVNDALRDGVAHYSMVRPSLLDPNLAGGSIVVRALPSSGRYYLAMNLHRRPFDDLRVRRAIATAIDRLEVVREALGGLGAPAVGWYTPDVEWAYNPDARVPTYDVAASRRLLADAGFGEKAGGERLHVRLVVPAPSSMVPIASVLETQLWRVGIRVTRETVSLAEWPSRVLRARDFDLALVGGLHGPDPDALRRRFLADTETGAYIGYSREAFREAVERGARAVNLEDRAAAYHRAQEILAEDVPFVPLAESVRVLLYNRRVSGLPQLEARGLVGQYDFSLVTLAAEAARGAP